MSDLKRRGAIVTGASQGIGAAVARRLGRDGFAVAVNYRKGRDDAEQVVRAIEGDGGRAIALQADIGDPTGAAALFDQAGRALGGIDVVVNNAGTMVLGPMADVTDADLDRQVSLNMAGAFRVMREAARTLQPGGRIVNLSSSVVGLYQPGYGIYAATKAAVEAMTHVLAKELGQKGITVNAVAPGPVETRLFLQGKSADQVAAIAGLNPFGRLGRPEDIAAAVAWLCGSDGAWINGQVIRANGGVV